MDVWEMSKQHNLHRDPWAHLREVTTGSLVAPDGGTERRRQYRSTWRCMQVGVSLVLFVAACSAPEDREAAPSQPSDSVVNASGGTRVSTSSSSVVSAAGGGRPGSSGERIRIDISNAGAATADATRIVECTDGKDCECTKVSVAVIGKSGKWGANTGNDTDTAFQDWLNSSSAGTAEVRNFTSRPTLTREFLDHYNVIVLASLAEDSNSGPFWTFSEAELEAVREWVEVSGGGLITLSGYAGSGDETLPTNQLVSFSDLSYNTDTVFADCTILDQNGNPSCWCGGNSAPMSEFVRDDPAINALSRGVTWVGIHNGRSINASVNAHVAATVTSQDGSVKNTLVGQIVGKGRVLMYSDEWITYTSQWNGEGNVNSTNATCQGSLPQDVYQTAQFWYNMIKWVQPSATCFKIVDVEQRGILW